MRVIPERASRMGGGDVEFVLEAERRIDAQQHVVAIAARIDPMASVA